MKYLVVISLLIIYLASAFQSSWTLIDFYMNRDDFTNKYCEFLDQGITQCRASCYLEKIMSHEENGESKSQILPSYKTKVVEIICGEVTNLIPVYVGKETYQQYYSKPYTEEFRSTVFRPPIL